MSKRDRLLPPEEVAERFGTSIHFVRRLVQEKRIQYVKLGRKVRIPESAVDAMIEKGTVDPIVRRRRPGRRRAA